jgi:hypothetical protein
VALGSTLPLKKYVTGIVLGVKGGMGVRLTNLLPCVSRHATWIAFYKFAPKEKAFVFWWYGLYVMFLDYIFESFVFHKDCLCGLVVRVPGYRTEMYCVSCEVRTEFIYVM